MYVYIWEYRVHPESRDAFREVYGPSGDWVTLFRRSPDYVDTTLLQSTRDELLFCTIDRWQSVRSFRAFRSDFAIEFEAIDQRCASLTVEERELGQYES